MVTRRLIGGCGPSQDPCLALVTAYTSHPPHHQGETRWTTSPTIRRFYELINAGEIDAFGELLADDFVEHEETPGLAPTKAGVMDFFRASRVGA